MLNFNTATETIDIIIKIIIKIKKAVSKV